ncbi:hypothetical protein EB837_17445 [Kluyvera ascorbata]|uniref:Uncharacterized protein n=1 Tax=Kluyvera ascorbata TaxID=51288 RepID=A0A3N2RX46_9ENTR|nr:hypothetical protein EB837_17445 [Kluyvera ascorbata]
MSLLDEKRGLLYWKFSLAISPEQLIRLFAERLLPTLTKINNNYQFNNLASIVRYAPDSPFTEEQPC